MLILKVFWLVVLFMTNNLVTKHPWMIGFVEYPCPPQRKYDKNFGSLFFMNHSTQLRVIPTPWTNIGTRGGWETFDIGTYIQGDIFTFFKRDIVMISILLLKKLVAVYRGYILLPRTKNVRKPIQDLSKNNFEFVITNFRIRYNEFNL